MPTPPVPVQMTPSSQMPRKQSEAEKRDDVQDKNEEDAFTPSVNIKPARKIVSVPTPETSKASAQSTVSGEDVQNKIAALQRQLSDLTKNKA
jgi:wobble nucleotide-excising tRNase